MTALDSINCAIEKGCIYGMVGSNGSGKSTLLRLLSGVYKPDGGRAMLDGEDIYENTKAKANIAASSSPDPRLPLHRQKPSII